MVAIGVEFVQLAAIGRGHGYLQRSSETRLAIANATAAGLVAVEGTVGCDRERNRCADRRLATRDTVWSVAVRAGTEHGFEVAGRPDPLHFVGGTVADIEKTVWPNGKRQ